MVQDPFLEVRVLEMWLGVMGSILEDHFMSQLKLLLESWRNGPVDAGLFFWREIHFFVLTQISSLFPTKIFGRRKRRPRGHGP